MNKKYLYRVWEVASQSWCTAFSSNRSYWMRFLDAKRLLRSHYKGERVIVKYELVEVELSEDEINQIDNG